MAGRVGSRISKGIPFPIQESPFMWSACRMVVRTSTAYHFLSSTTSVCHGDGGWIQDFKESDCIVSTLLPCREEITFEVYGSPWTALAYNADEWVREDALTFAHRLAPPHGRSYVIGGGIDCVPIVTDTFFFWEVERTCHNKRKATMYKRYHIYFISNK